MSIYDFKNLLGPENINGTKTPKFGVVWHFTAGSHDPIAVVDAWKQTTTKVGAHAVIGRTSRKGDTKYNGKIVQAVDSDYWLWQLGIKAKNDVLNKPHGYYDQRLLGIEICNYGPLTLVDGKFMTYVNSEIPADQVCDLGAGNEYRGFRYYHAVTAEQLDAACRLTAHYANVCGFKIETGRVFTDTDFRYDIGFAHSKTVTVHTNWRLDKTDWAPQPALIEALNRLHAAPQDFGYKPK